MALGFVRPKAISGPSWILGIPYRGDLCVGLRAATGGEAAGASKFPELDFLYGMIWPLG